MTDPCAVGIGALCRMSENLGRENPSLGGQGAPVQSDHSPAVGARRDPNAGAGPARQGEPVGIAQTPAIVGAGEQPVGAIAHGRVELE